MQVDPFSSVSAAHDIGENVRQQIHKLHNEVAEVFIHIGKCFGFPFFFNLKPVDSNADILQISIPCDVLRFPCLQLVRLGIV